VRKSSHIDVERKGKAVRTHITRCAEHIILLVLPEVSKMMGLEPE